jgi:UDP-N-acetylmuramoyl-tripeptide--D-alanyl-D-alanine ligase
MMATPIPQNRASFTAATIARVTGGAIVGGDAETAAVGVCTDTRAVVSGNVFVALRGAAFDGHAFLQGAVSAGAAVLVVARDHARESLPSGVSVVAVDDTLMALGRMAHDHRARWASLKSGRAVVIAITGSAGKTTTKELTAAAMAACVGDDAVHLTAGNLNNRIGVPMTLFGLEPAHEVAVVEAGMSLRGEIAELASIIAPDVAVLTHVGVAHAEGIADPGEAPEAAVLREKSPLLLAATACAIASADEPIAVTILRGISARRAFTFGRHERATHRLLSVEPDDQVGSRVTLQRAAGAMTVSLPLLGNVAAIDLCAAVAAAEAAVEVLGGATLDAVALDAALQRRVRPVPGRLAPRRRRDGALVIDDTYNASPSAFRESLETAREVARRTGRRLVVVAGEMRELGAIAQAAHEEVGRAVAAVTPAVLVTIGPEARHIGAQMTSSPASVLHAESSGRAAALVGPMIEANDVVLVKGSRGVETELVVEAILARGGEIVDAGTRPHGRGR